MKTDIAWVLGMVLFLSINIGYISYIKKQVETPVPVVEGEARGAPTTCPGGCGYPQDYSYLPCDGAPWAYLHCRRCGNTYLCLWSGGKFYTHRIEVER